MNHREKDLFSFPQHLPNDLEGFIFFYPKKFPKLVSYYEEVAKKYFRDPEGFEKYAEQALQDMRTGLDNIMARYNSSESRSLEFLLDIDERLHKLYAFRFWVVNYLMADGPLHEHYVDVIRHHSRMLIEAEEDIEGYEGKVQSIERDLLQSDYADLYLQNALNGAVLMEVLRKDKESTDTLDEISDLLKKNDFDLNQQIYRKLDPLIDEAYEGKTEFGKKLAELMFIAIEQADFRKTRDPLYHMIVHSIEFEKENIELKERHDKMNSKIQAILDLAKKRLNDIEYEDFEIAYKMARVLSKSKDVMGKIDGVLLPFWMGMLVDMGNMISNYKGFQLGPGGVFYELVWRLPEKLKVKVFTPDPTDFSLEEL